MNPGDKESEEKFKEAPEAYAVLSDAEKRNSMISLVMQHLRMARQAADMVDLIYRRMIWEISLEIFSEICSVAVDAEGGGEQWTDERCEYPYECQDHI